MWMPASSFAPASPFSGGDSQMSDGWGGAPPRNPLAHRHAALHMSFGSASSSRSSQAPWESSRSPHSGTTGSMGSMSSGALSDYWAGGSSGGSSEWGSGVDSCGSGAPFSLQSVGATDELLALGRAYGYLEHQQHQLPVQHLMAAGGEGCALTTVPLESVPLEVTGGLGIGSNGVVVKARLSRGGAPGPVVEYALKVWCHASARRHLLIPLSGLSCHLRGQDVSLSPLSSPRAAVCRSSRRRATRVPKTLSGLNGSFK